MPRIKCPACGSRNTARIQYGMPMLDEELQRKLDNKTVMLGGCCISLESITAFFPGLREKNPQIHCY
ncbi:MAG: hypothetical protein ACRCZH_06010 [Cetobacterium sp.]